MSAPGMIGFERERRARATGSRNRCDRPSSTAGAECRRRGRLRVVAVLEASTCPVEFRQRAEPRDRHVLARRGRPHARRRRRAPASLRSLLRICGRPTTTSTVSAVGLRSPRRAITGRSVRAKVVELRAGSWRRWRFPATNRRWRRCGRIAERRDFVAHRLEERSRCRGGGESRPIRGSTARSPSHRPRSTTNPMLGMPVRTRL